MRVNFCFCIFPLLGFVEIQSIPSTGDLKKAANVFSEILHEQTNKITNYKLLDNDFKTLFNGYDFQKRDGKKLNDEFKTKIEKFFTLKEKSIRNLTNKTRELESKYTYDPNIELFDYPNVRDIDPSPNASIIAIDPKYPTGVKINQTKSFVQVPTNIYSGNKDILNKVKWTEKLDEVFIENQQDDVSLILQYYCDSSGRIDSSGGRRRGKRKFIFFIYKLFLFSFSFFFYVII